MAYIPNSGSVVAFQGNPSALQALVGLHSTNASVITVGGAVANQSVSGTIHVDNFSSVVSYQLAGSVLATSATITPAANQSVSGTVGASVIGHAPVFIVGGSILTSSTPNQSVSGTVVATQIAGSVLAVSGSFAPAANQSVSGTVGARLESTNASVIAFGGEVDSNNSTTATLGISSVFTGTGTDVLKYGVIYANVFADQNSATNGLKFQYSQDNTNWNDTIAGGFDYIANTARRFQFSPQSKYFRVQFTNGTTPQTAFRLETVLSQLPQSLTTIHRMDADVVPDRSATLVKAGIVAQINGSGDFTPIQANSAGILKIGGTVDQGTGWGSVAAHVKSGSVVAVLGGNTSVVVANFPTTQNVSGSVSAWLQSTNASVITVGSPVANQSVSGAVSISNFPTNQNISGSVSAWLQSTNASVITVGSPVANQSVSGTVDIGVQSGSVVAFQGTPEWTVKSSIAGGIFPISGSVAAVVTSGNVNVSGSVIAQIASSVLTVTSGTVTANQGTGFGSIAAHIKSGSVIAVLGGNTSVLAIQSGTVITSISGIPQASIHGAVTFLPASVVSGHGSVNGAASVQILAAPGAGLHNYVTDILLSNTGAATTLVTITDGDASIMGKLIAPATGGAVATAMSSPMRTMATNKVVNISAATATSVLHAWIGGFKAP